eukprot:m.251474 g.251474  ORF g.251474 m.251474 type:complete len:199 (-) comp54513_c0_seq6:986-1582(-)
MSESEFQAAAAQVKALPIRPSDAELLDLYGLYKQATVGDNDSAQPWAVQFEARAKWDAWASRDGLNLSGIASSTQPNPRALLVGMSTEDARRAYIQRASEISSKLSSPKFLAPVSEADFQTAASKIKELTERPSNAELLDLYGLYKQATSGDNTTDQPWAVQVEARAKWDAWSSRKGMSAEDARRVYFHRANDILDRA